jgi:hypothetical protein
MTVLQVQSLPVLAHQHRSIIFFEFFLGVWLVGMYLTGWMVKAFFCSSNRYMYSMMTRHLSAICECDPSSTYM